jgi:hypothetical protein
MRLDPGEESDDSKLSGFLDALARVTKYLIG